MHFISITNYIISTSDHQALDCGGWGPLLYSTCMHSCFSHVPLCNAMGSSLPGFSLHVILQARVLEWFAMSSSGRSSWPRDRTLISYVSCGGRRFFTTGASFRILGKYFYHVLATLPLPSIPSPTYLVQESLLVFMEITNTGWVLMVLVFISMWSAFSLYLVLSPLLTQLIIFSILIHFLLLFSWIPHSPGFLILLWPLLVSLILLFQVHKMLRIHSVFGPPLLQLTLLS